MFSLHYFGGPIEKKKLSLLPIVYVEEKAKF
jgi:hypothetical protein